MDSLIYCKIDLIPKLHENGRIAKLNDLWFGPHSDILLEKHPRFPNKNEPVYVKIIAGEKENQTVITVQAFSETELVNQAQNGDRNAFSELVRVHAQGVRNVIYRMCGDAQLAEDAAQEAFIRAWQNLSSYRPGRRSATGCTASLSTQGRICSAGTNAFCPAPSMICI